MPVDGRPVEGDNRVVIALGLLSGTLFGFVLARGDMCVHAMFRAMAGPSPLRRAYLIAICLQAPILAVIIASGVIDPFIPPFRPVSNIVGGLIFGVGLVIAASCVSGLFTKLGQGMIGAAVGILGWAIGDILVTSGPIGAVRDVFDAAAPTATITLPGLLGPLGWPAVIAIGLAGLWLLSRPDMPNGRYWSARTTGLAIAAVTLIGWLIATLAGQGFAYGSVGAAASAVRALRGEGAPDWTVLILIGLTAGSVVAARLGGTSWLRGETPVRYVRLAGGGVVLGVGAAIAGGCSIGHVLVGVPLLSIGSITATIAMVAGVWIAVRVSLPRSATLAPAQ